MNIVQLSRKLSKLGLEPKELQVLASLFLSGPRSVTQISETSGVQRTHTYNILKALCDKRLVFEMTKNKVRQYTPADPDRLVEYLSEKQKSLADAKESISSLVPTLQLLTRAKGKRPRIRFFWGTDGLLSIYKETLKCKNKVIHAFCDFETVFPKDKNPVLHAWIWDYSDERAHADIIYKGIVKKSPGTDLAAKLRIRQKRELKDLPFGSLPVELNIFDDKVAFMSSYENFMGIVVQDEGVARSLLTIHQALWQVLPDYEI